ncbi:protein GOLM2 isoform X2 [Brachionichthys hirsutus]|uniref:protein GOLM2 isoform X2 n=1 Tax=Brachionichthys hirsutus TaxID=412623 RepID=UPI003604493C
MFGFGANRRGGRLPSFILVFLTVIVAVLSFNYWTVSTRHGRLQDELAEVHAQAKRTDAARSRLEKRNSELMVQVDAHRKQMEQKDADHGVLAGTLQAQETLLRKCSDEKMKLQKDVTAKMTETQRLTEQLKELNQEFIKKESQLNEVKKNSTTFEKKLEYESLQCGRQMAQLKEEYEETRKSLEKEAAKLRLRVMEVQEAGVVGRHAEGGAMGGEGPIVPTQRHTGLGLKEQMGEPGDDAGMPGIEDGEVGKMEDVQFGLKEPAVVGEQMEDPFPGPGQGVGAADGLRGLSLDWPRLQRDGAEADAKPKSLIVVKQAQKSAVFEEDGKDGIQADELGEQQRQLRAPGVKAVDDRVKGIPLPPNPAQARRDPEEPVHHRQNDDDREVQGGHAVDYGKRQQPIDGL